MYTVILFAAVLIITIVHIFLRQAPVLETLLLWLLVINVGLGGVWAFMGHYFKSDEIAAYIGWPAGNPFQKEVAFTNLAMGVCGLLCFFFRGDFQLATIIFTTVFLVGAFSVHLQDQKEAGNKKPGNAGMVFFMDIGLPALLWVLFIFK
jgi:hypothetical protein